VIEPSELMEDLRSTSAESLLSDTVSENTSESRSQNERFEGLFSSSSWSQLHKHQN